MNLNKLSNTQKLRTDRNIWIIAIKGGLTLGILWIWESYLMCKDLNVIIAPYTNKKAGFDFFSRRVLKLMQEEIARRGINYKLTKNSNFVNALNVLCEDYNRKGC